MDKKKIVIVSDFSFKGSGYLNIVLPLSTKLADAGYDVKAVGLAYTGEEHDFPISIIPCMSFPDAHAMVNNLHYQWQTDLVIVALDIPSLERFSALCKGLKLPMIAITPLENPPLRFSWSLMLQEIEKVFFISQLGADEARKVNLDAEHLMVGIDSNSWRLRTELEYTEGRKMMNISDDTLVVITVADNQERKNLASAFEIVSKLKNEKHKKVRYVLVTKEHSEVGWGLRDLAMQYNISSELMVFERGLPFKELYALYAISDVYLLTSKAEGLCMPVMEAMCLGVPVVATDCGSMPELLAEGRGFLMPTAYSVIDPWGNSRRDFPNTNSGADIISELSEGKLKDTATKAREYMETRTWEYPTKQVISAIEEIINENSAK